MFHIYNDDYRNVINEIIDDIDNPVIVTDPPFNIGYHYKTYNDNMSENDYYKMLSELRQYAPIVMVHYPESLYRFSIEINEAPTRVASWIYNSNTKKQHRDIAFFGIIPDFNLVKRPYYDLNDKRCLERMKKTGGARSYDWQYTNQVKNISKEKTSHPCQMPLDIMRWIVGVIPGNVTIIDPFCGSGTTGVACLMDDRDFIGMEIDKEYFEIANNRLSNTNVCDKYMQQKVI